MDNFVIQFHSIATIKKFFLSDKQILSKATSVKIVDSKYFSNKLVQEASSGLRYNKFQDNALRCLKLLHHLSKNLKMTKIYAQQNQKALIY